MSAVHMDIKFRILLPAIRIIWLRNALTVVSPISKCELVSIQVLPLSFIFLVCHSEIYCIKSVVHHIVE